LCGLTFALAAGAAHATPYDYVPVGDPIESEIRLLDLLAPAPLQNRLRLPHLNTRPLQLIELQGLGPAPVELDRVRSISVARIERLLGRDRAPLFAPHHEYESTPRLFETNSTNEALEISAGAEGRLLREEGDSQVESGSGFHGRIALGLDRLLMFSHYVVGRFDNARRFADPIVPENDVIVLTEETFLSYTEEQGRWGAQYGRSRWHWGPGEEGSLVLSKTSPSMTGLAFRARHDGLRADGIALSATLEAASGEQLAAHRIEWELARGLRLGVTETARYRSPGWQPLYMIGIIPYVLVQRLHMQSEPDSLRILRNNILMSFDATWRVGEGSRLYGEFLIDDLHAKSGKIPNKFAYQFGWEGAGLIGRQRLTWGGEWTRLSRFVYTSFFGRDYVVQGRPLGFPTGPDARRIRLRMGWDPGPDWTLFGHVVHNDKGENEISEPFLPNSPRVQSSHFQGVVETSREAQVGVRWWPASGVYAAVSAGYRWVRNWQHVVGREHQVALATVELRLNR
jgi:hypothetical protein